MPEHNEDKQSNRIICEGGLDSTENHLNLSINKPGCATNLINYEVGVDGGYRRVTGYSYYDAAFSEVGVGVAEGKVLAIAIFDNTATGTTQIIAARKTLAANTYKFYLYTSGVGWTAIADGLTHTYTSGAFTVSKIRWDTGHDGARNHICFVDGVNNAVLYDGVTWAEIDSADTGAAMATAGGNQAINAPELVCFFENTLFLASDTRNSFKGLVTYSAPEAFYKWTTAGGAGQLSSGFEVQQIRPFRETLYSFGINGIKKITADVTAGFLINDVTHNIGLIARDAIVEIGGDLIFLGPDGFRPVAGTDKIGDVQLETLSKPIQSVIQRVTTFGELDNFNAVVIRSKSQFRVFTSDDSLDTIDAKGIIGGLRTADQQAGWEFGLLQGFRCSCVTSRYIGTEEFVLHGDYDGKVYRQESGNDLNGTAIFSRYDTPYIDFGDTEIEKVMEKITIFIKGSGTLNLTMGVVYNWGDPNKTNPTNYTISLTGTTIEYGDGTLYDSGAVYGGLLTPMRPTNIEGSCFSIKLRFTTYGSDAPYSMHGIIYEYSTKGRL